MARKIQNRVFLHSQNVIGSAGVRSVQGMDIDKVRAGKADRSGTIRVPSSTLSTAAGRRLSPISPHESQATLRTTAMMLPAAGSLLMFTLAEVCAVQFVQRIALQVVQHPVLSRS